MFRPIFAIVLLGLLLLTLLSFGLYQISKGVQLQQLNAQHLILVSELRDMLKMADDVPVATDQATSLIIEIRDQPIQCLQLLQPLDRVFLRLTGTFDAINICYRDIALADRALQEIARSGSSELDIRTQDFLAASVAEFSDNSRDFQVPVDHAITLMTRFTVAFLLSFTFAILLVIFIVVRRMYQAFESAEKAGLEVARVREQNLHLAHYDHITGLPNRVMLERHVERELQRVKGEGSNLQIIACSVERINKIYAGMGTAAGDQLVGKIAQKLRQAIPERDFIAQTESNEFVIVSTHASDPHLAGSRLAARLLSTIATEFSTTSGEAKINAEAGISMAPADGRDAAELIKRARLALQKAQDEGPGSYRFYSAELGTLAKRRLHLEAKLRKAIAGDELRMHYQPLIALDQLEVSGAEALMRWDLPETGPVPPKEFIAIAEQTDQIIDLGWWAFEQILSQISDWCHHDIRPGPVSANVSVSQLRQPGFTKQLEALLSRHQVSADMLRVEVTESIMIERDEICSRTLDELHELGVCLLLDDFGTGFSSFGYLSRLPFSVLKIDRAFIDRCEQSEKMGSIVSSIIGMAHGLGLKVVAEGIETKQTIEFLREQGCDFGQGYFLGRPVPAASLNWTRQRSPTRA